MTRLRMLFILMISLILVSCSWRPGYEKEYQAQEAIAKKACQDYGQEYVQMFYNQGRWSVICKQNNPVKIFTKVLE